MRRIASNPLSTWSLAMLASGVIASAGCRSALEPSAPTGGTDLQLDAGIFAHDIEPILQQRGCSNIACHGGQGSGELLLSGGLDAAADLTAIGGFVIQSSPEESAILRKPLAEAAGGVVHSGGEIFLDVQDEDYQLLLRWIAGEGAP